MIDKDAPNTNEELKDILSSLNKNVRAAHLNWLWALLSISAVLVVVWYFQHLLERADRALGDLESQLATQKESLSGLEQRIRQVDANVEAVVRTEVAAKVGRELASVTLQYRVYRSCRIIPYNNEGIFSRFTDGTFEFVVRRDSEQNYLMIDEAGRDIVIPDVGTIVGVWFTWNESGNSKFSQMAEVFQRLNVEPLGGNRVRVNALADPLIFESPTRVYVVDMHLLYKMDS